MKTINNSLFLASILDAYVHVKINYCRNFYAWFCSFLDSNSLFLLFPGVCVAELYLYGGGSPVIIAICYVSYLFFIWKELSKLIFLVKKVLWCVPVSWCSFVRDLVRSCRDISSNCG